MRVLGISAFQRDSAAALVVDGEVVAAAQEASFSKKRSDSAMPKRAIRHCLEAAKVAGPDLDAVVFYEKPLRKFERLLASQLQAFPRSARVFSRSMFVWLGDRLWVKGRLAEEVGVPVGRVHFVEHQLSHAAQAYFSSPFEEAAVLVLDDVGEWATTLLAKGVGARVERVDEMHFPHSLGLFSSAITQFLGFEPGADEHHVEALAAWGEPSFQEALSRLLPRDEDGAFTADTERFRYHFDPDVLFDSGLHEVLGSHREPGGPLRFEGSDRRDADVAASLQAVLEERALALCGRLADRTGADALCLGGSLASNRRLLARLRTDGPFARVHVPPASGKAGAALGAALLYHGLADAPVEPPRARRVELGTPIDGLAEQGATELGDGALAEAARRLATGETVGWARGAAEFADESHANRLLLVAAGAEDARARLLGTVQRGEPFATCRVLLAEEDADASLGLPTGADELLAHGRLVVEASDALRALAPSAVAPDGRVVVQLVGRDRYPDLHALLAAFRDASGQRALLADSLHLRGMPTVRTELDAVEAFRRSTLDALFVGSRLYEPGA